MRYIDTDALKARVHERTKRCNAGSVLESAYMEAETLIDEAPAADVTPVVHAKLKVIERRGDKVVLVQCSACNGYSRDGLYVLYCPHCGAIMDWP